jgi:BirA family biotin operon repressor/biotin-[acetyl-CoA-carboxylase] ligase
MASMAIIDAIQEDLDNECSNLEIKWPNDVLFNGRKMAGILQEGSLEGETLKAVALGIGINVNTSADFFEQVDLPDATSLLIETGKTWDVEVLRDSILRHLDGLYSVFKDSL